MHPVGVRGVEHLPDIRSDEIRATLDAAELLTGIGPPAQLANVASRIDAPLPGVAVIGMVKRGKSYLFNRLIGARLAPEHWLPESFLLLAASSGVPKTTARTQAGEAMWPADVVEVRDRVTRSQEEHPEDLRWVHFQGDLRLPRELLLVDTPGQGEADIAHRPGDLDESWREAPAGAGVVVLTPMSQAADIRLATAANEVFGGNVLAVLHSGGNDVSVDELRELADYYRSQLPMSVLVIDTEQTLPDVWGGGWSELEVEIVRLSERGAVSNVDVLRRYDDFVATLATEVASRELDDRLATRWRQVLGMFGPDVDERLVIAVRVAIDRECVTSTETRLDTALRTSRRFSDAKSAPTTPEARQAFLDLLAIAGSNPRAEQTVLTLLRSDTDRELLVPKESDLLQRARQAGVPSVVSFLEERKQARRERHEAAERKREAKARDRDGSLAAQRGSLLARQADGLSSLNPAEFTYRLDQAYALLGELREWDTSASNYPQCVAAVPEVRARWVALHARYLDATGFRLLGRANALYSRPVPEVNAWLVEVEAVRSEVRVWLGEAQGVTVATTDLLIRLRTWLQNSVADGSLWAEASIVARDEAVERTATCRGYWALGVPISGVVLLAALLGMQAKPLKSVSELVFTFALIALLTSAVQWSRRASAAGWTISYRPPGRPKEAPFLPW